MSNRRDSTVERLQWLCSTEQVCEDVKDRLTKFAKEMSESSNESLKILRQLSVKKGTKEDT